jgi:hypothetical protein
MIQFPVHLVTRPSYTHLRSLLTVCSVAAGCFFNLMDDLSIDCFRTKKMSQPLRIRGGLGIVMSDW